MLNVAVSYLFLSTSRSQTRTEPLNVPKLTSSKDKEKDKDTNVLKLAREVKTDQTKNKEQAKVRIELKKLKRSMSSVSHTNRQTGKYYDDSLLGRHIKPPPPPPRSNDFVSDSPKPLPKKKTKLLFPAVGKVVFQYTSSKNKNKTDSNQQLRIPSVPAPSYDDATSGDANYNPYRLPPLPVDHREIHRLPSNMYLGNAYPDTEIVAVQPHEVSRR